MPLCAESLRSFCFQFGGGWKVQCCLCGGLVWFCEDRCGVIDGFWLVELFEQYCNDDCCRYWRERFYNLKNFRSWKNRKDDFTGWMRFPDFFLAQRFWSSKWRRIDQLNGHVKYRKVELSVYEIMRIRGIGHQTVGDSTLSHISNNFDNIPALQRRNYQLSYILSFMLVIMSE